MRASRIQHSGRHGVNGTRPCYQRASRRTSASGPRAGENTSGAATSASGVADFRLGRREALQGAGLLLLAQAAPAGAAAGALSTAAPLTQQAVVTRRKELEFEVDKNGLRRAKYERDGWNFWQWNNYSIHFAEAGRPGNPVVLLIHGYGASAYHWRYQFDALAEAGYHVYAMDLIGFGLSQKAALDYSNGKPWVQQISDFIQQVIGGGQVIIAGNSLGAYASLAAAAERPDLISAVALLNGAGPFRDGPESKRKPAAAADSSSPLASMTLALQTAIKRATLYFGFLYAKNPIRIKQVLELVYKNTDQIDSNLVTSIIVPAEDPDAADVFFRINNMIGEPRYVDELLDGMSLPMLLLWGDADPWIVPARAEKVKSLYPAAELKFIPSGHCPHDDTPKMANEVLLEWLRGLRPVAL